MHSLYSGVGNSCEEFDQEMLYCKDVSGRVNLTALISLLMVLLCCAACCAMLCAAGVAGVVLSAATSVPLAATLVVEGINRNTTADELFGYYNRSA
jgi:hypothetical protein